MIPKIHLAGFWCGVFYLVTFTIGLLLAGDVPIVPAPATDTAGVVQFYQNNLTGIRLGNIFIMMAAAFYLPWTVTLSALIRRMEGEENFLSQSQLIAGVTVALFFLLPALIWDIAAFRPTTDPNIINMLNDTGWLFFVTPVPAFLGQSIPFTAAMFMDRNSPRLLPRWFMTFTIATDVLFIPGLGASFYRTGPLAWNGLLAFWVPALVFFAWEGILLVLILKVIKTPRPHSVETGIARHQPTAGNANSEAAMSL